MSSNSYADLSHERLGIAGLMQPCSNSDHPGTLFLPINFGKKTPANALANAEALDPLAKIPAFKVSAMNIAKLSEQARCVTL